MGDSDDNKQVPLAPSWQQAAPSPTDDAAAASPESTLDQARRFLQEESVRDASREKKVEFLKSKGLDEADITALLDETTEPTTNITTTTTTTPPAPLQTSVQPTTPQTLESAVASSPESNNTSSKPDHPPIVTYPEFLTTPLKPPPLITAAGLLNALTTIAAASTLLYGATTHIVSPMVTALTQARVDLHSTANTHLTTLVAKLERAVSELPPGYGHTHTTSTSTTAHPNHNDAASTSSSTYDDPIELFHRDVGVQTSPPPSPKLPSYLNINPLHTTPAARATDPAAQLARLAKNVRALATDVVSQTEALAATKGELEAFGADLHELTYPRETFGVGSSYLYGTSAAAAKNEPDDEIKRVKTSIRGVKGVLLSTRSFPATTW